MLQHVILLAYLSAGRSRSKILRPLLTFIPSKPAFLGKNSHSCLTCQPRFCNNGFTWISNTMVIAALLCCSMNDLRVADSPAQRCDRAAISPEPGEATSALSFPILYAASQPPCAEPWR